MPKRERPPPGLRDLPNRVVRLDRTTDALQVTIDKCCKELDTQFKRIAQLQAQLDEIRGAWTRMKVKPVKP